MDLSAEEQEAPRQALAPFVAAARAAPIPGAIRLRQEDKVFAAEGSTPAPSEFGGTRMLRRTRACTRPGARSRGIPSSQRATRRPRRQATLKSRLTSTLRTWTQPSSSSVTTVRRCLRCWSTRRSQVPIAQTTTGSEARPPPPEDTFDSAGVPHGRHHTEKGNPRPARGAVERQEGESHPPGSGLEGA